MISKGHALLLDEALRIFSIKYPKLYAKYDNLNDMKQGMVDPDHMEKPLGSHYGIYDEKTDTFNNRIVDSKINAFSMLVDNYNKAISEKNMYRLGFALHFVVDMLTIPHATGLTDMTIKNIFIRPHLKYEKYTACNMEKYYQDVQIDEEFFLTDIKEIIKKQTKTVVSFKNKMKKKYYDEINYTMIPIILNYLVGFLYRYRKDVDDVEN